MRLIIDVPEKVYQNAREDMLSGSELITNAIKNGTPIEQEPCGDCISRELVLRELDKYLCGVPFDEKGIDEVIKNLPSVQPRTDNRVKTELNGVKTELEQEACDCISRAEAMTEIQMNAKRYSLSKEFGGMRQVEWSDFLISIRDALSILMELPSIQLETKQELKTDYEVFAEWVAKEVIDEENWDLNQNAFAEIACRKLAKLGMVEESGDNWVLKESEVDE